jgi:hypothetical protein
VPDITETPLTVIVANALVRVGVTVTDVVAFVIVAVYDIVPLLNVGVNVPEEIVKAESDDTLDILCTVSVYVLVVVPSSAVTTTVTVLSPTLKLIEPEAEPDDTVTVLTLIVA